MRRNEIATGYFTSLVKDYNLEYRCIVHNRYYARIRKLKIVKLC